MKKNVSKSKRRARKRRLSIAKILPRAHTRRRWWKKYRSLSPRTQLVVGVIAVAMVWLAANWVYQVIRKPSELFFPVSGTLFKTPQETWGAYGTIFRRHSTTVMTPDLLAALAQTEGSGNPVARTYWRWSFTNKPFEIYKPASSAVGMYQITDGTFEVARRLCIHDHVVVEDGPWNAWRSCWFNALYSRVVPTNAVEMTSANLDRQVSRILAGQRFADFSLQQKQNLAIVIHLCGAGAGENYARRGLRLLPNQQCGDHDATGYIARVNAMRVVFARLQKSEE
jgi:hypothetical protein